jgi:hypothetical protein
MGNSILLMTMVGQVSNGMTTTYSVTTLKVVISDYTLGGTL